MIVWLSVFVAFGVVFALWFQEYKRDDDSIGPANPFMDYKTTLVLRDLFWGWIGALVGDLLYIVFITQGHLNDSDILRRISLEAIFALIAIWIARSVYHRL